MTRILSITVLLIMMLALATTADAHRWGRYYGHGYGCRGYYAPVPAPYCRPYYPPPPVFQDRFIQPHWRRGPYGEEWVPGHWVRVRVG